MSFGSKNNKKKRPDGNELFFSAFRIMNIEGKEYYWVAKCDPLPSEYKAYHDKGVL